MSLSVEEHLHLAENHRQAAHAALCRTCGHPYVDHEHDGRCWWPRIAAFKLAAPSFCRCKAFMDPALFPPAEQLTMETNP